MNTPLHKLADQTAAEMVRLEDLRRRRDHFKEKGLDEEIAQLEQAIEVKIAIVEGLKRDK